MLEQIDREIEKARQSLELLVVLVAADDAATATRCEADVLKVFAKADAILSRLSDLEDSRGEVGNSNAAPSLPDLAATTVPLIGNSVEQRYGDWLIYPTDPVPPISNWRKFAWTYAHKDYDGPEDNRFGYAADPMSCVAEITEWEAERGR